METLLDKNVIELINALENFIVSVDCSDDSTFIYARERSDNSKEHLILYKVWPDYHHFFLGEKFLTTQHINEIIEAL